MAFPHQSKDGNATHPSFSHTTTSPFGDEHEDVTIPENLLQAASVATPSKRDVDEPRPNWQPQRGLTVRVNSLIRKTSEHHPNIQRPAPVQRSSTLPSQRTTPNVSREPPRTRVEAARRSKPTAEEKLLRQEESRKKWEKRMSGNKKSRNSWRLSYTPGIAERLTLTPQPSSVDLRSQHRYSEYDSNPFTDPSRSNSGRSDSPTVCAESVYTTTTEKRTSRQSKRQSMLSVIVPDGVQQKIHNASNTLKRSNTLRQTFERAKTRGLELQRNKWAQLAFEYGIYAFLLLFVYFVLIGVPLWKGAVWWLYWIVANKFVFAGGFGITLGIALFYAFAPLFILFEKDPPVEEFTAETKIQPNVQDTALLIPCYKSAGLIAATLEAALKIFPPSHIFVLANGNSPTPLDNTEEICRPYGVTHLWSPVGSKIVAQFVGCYAAKNFKNVLLIDDDCALPENFPVVTDRLVGKVKCIGYTIKSVGPNSSKGNYCQQAQDLEYKLSGLQRDFAGKIGSATFPHGAIALWDRELLVKTFYQHPGFSVSEDWFFGHAARQLGCRIKMCSSVFVETETPTAVFVSGGGSRGGFGEMTIFSQRFKRWNFFFVNGMWYNMAYIFFNWKLGFWEIGAKLFVFQEVYETLLYLMTPFILPISFYVRPSFAGILLASTVVMYLINVIIFNEVHLRRKNERIGWQVLYLYYLPYKIVLTVINVGSCYWSLWKYARYFAKRHPKVIEDEHAVGVVVRLEEDAAAGECGLGRRLTVTALGSKGSEMQSAPNGLDYDSQQIATGMSTPTRVMEGIGATDFAAAQPKQAGARPESRYSAQSELTTYSAAQMSTKGLV